MLMTLLVVLVVSGALVAGAAIGLFAPLRDRLEGFIVALAGGALLVSVTSELIEPSVERGALLAAVGGVAAGACVFAGANFLIDKKWGPQSGGGLLAAITLDGIPENLALGVALIGAGVPEVAALAGSILLSNLPEAAGGARQMQQSGFGKGRIIVLWSVTALILSLATIAGNLLLTGANEHTLGFIRCFAAGAVIASLATEVFPQAYREDHNLAGVATAIGAIAALLLGTMGS